MPNDIEEDIHELAEKIEESGKKSDDNHDLFKVLVGESNENGE